MASEKSNDYLQNNDKEPEIRKPDEYKKDRLFNKNDPNQEELDFQLGLRLSLNDINVKNIMFEEKLISEFKTEKEQRQELCKNILLQINKVSKYDTKLKKVYEIICPILEMYYEQMFNSYELDIDTYELIFNNLKSLRIEEHEIDLLKTILFCEISL